MMPVTNEAALYLKEDGLLVIADLHIGVEYELREEGLSMGTRTNLLIKKIKRLSQILGTKYLLILGDLKHIVPKSTSLEKEELLKFVDSLSHLKISLIPGNHDGGIRKILEDKIEILPSDGIVIKDVGFLHGHRWPNKDVVKAKTLVLAHTHPVFTFKDRFGYRFAERCWIVSKPNYDELEKRYEKVRIENVLIMPAFNPICGGLSVNEERLTGITGKLVDSSNMEIFLIDGTYIGKV